MSFIIFNPERESHIRSQLEVFTRLGAIALIALYVAGFAVVTFANASRGIVGFGFFRAKILTAGILFWFFMVLPLIDWSRVFGKFGFPQTAVESHSTSLLLVKMFRFVMAAWAMAFFLCIYVLGCELHWRSTVLFVAFVGAGVAIVMFFPKDPIVSARLSVAMTAFGAGGLILLNDRRIMSLIGWFLLVGFYAYLVEKDVQEGKHPLNFNWHWTAIYIVLTVSYFTTWLYPHISPTLGGGKPTEATFQFVSVSPVDGQAMNHVWMLDEVDAGYYILRDPNEHKAIFLPRALVSAIYFDAGPHDTLLP